MNTERATNDNFITGLENWGKQLLVNQVLEELTADIALAIEQGTCKWTSSSESEPRFTTEVVSPSHINVIDTDGAEYVVTVARK